MLKLRLVRHDETLQGQFVEIRVVDDRPVEELVLSLEENVDAIKTGDPLIDLMPGHDQLLTYFSIIPILCDRNFRTTEQMSTFFSVRSCWTRKHIATNIELLSVPVLEGMK